MRYLDLLKDSRTRLLREYRIKVEKTASSADAVALREVISRELEIRDEEIEFEISRTILLEAKELDVEIPSPDDPKVWRLTTFGIQYLGPSGRSDLRKLIDGEKTRRFEAKTRWITKFILPLLAAIIGIIAALTGLVAVLQHHE